MKSIVGHGLPPLANSKLGTTGASLTQSKHFCKAEVSVGDFRVLDDLNLAAPTTNDAIWRMHSNTGLGRDNEEAVKQHVIIVLSDLLATAGITDVRVVSEIELHSLKPDAWLIMFNGSPIGVVEVKMPGSESDNAFNKSLGDQIASYLLMLRSFHGIAHPFGIGTTYNKWRAYWLPEADESAASTSLFSGTVAPIPLDKNKPVDIHASKWYGNGTDIASFICSVLKKMRNSPSGSVSWTDGEEKACLELHHDNAQWKWRKGPESLKSGMIGFANPESVLLVLKDLHGDTHGHCWKICNSNGVLGVIKFGDKSTLDAEAEAWNAIWKDYLDLEHSIRVGSWDAHDALLMPFCEPVTEEQEKEDHIQHLVRDALKRYERV